MGHLSNDINSSLIATNPYFPLVTDGLGKIFKQPVINSLNSVLNNTIIIPPITPVLNDSYIVPVGATGVWSTNVNKIAKWTGNDWTYYSPVINDKTSVVTGINAGKQYNYNGTTWIFINTLNAGNIIASTPYNAVKETVVVFDGFEIKWHSVIGSFDGIAIRSTTGNKLLRYTSVEFYNANAVIDGGKSTWGSANAWYNLPTTVGTATILNTTYPYAQTIGATFMGMGNPALPNNDFRIYKLYNDTDSTEYIITIDKQASTGEVTTVQNGTCSIIVEKVGITSQTVFTAGNGISLNANQISSVIKQYGNTYTKEINLTGTTNNLGVITFDITSAGFTANPTNIQVSAFLTGATNTNCPIASITSVTLTTIAVRTVESNSVLIGGESLGNTGIVTVYLRATGN